MKEQLSKYVDLLFAGTSGAEEIRQEILQNTLDRYDDLIHQGKSPEAAYRLAISGIGDINEILSSIPAAPSAPVSHYPIPEETDDRNSRKMRAAAIAMYIACPIPLLILSEFGLDTLGLCLLLLLVAAATALMIMAKKHEPDLPEADEAEIPETPRSKLQESIDTLCGVVTLAVYLLVSFYTKAWSVTWLIFPISGCIKGIVSAILDLKEAKNHEA